MPNEDGWDRIHPCFSELLRNRLKKTRPSELPALNLRASEWYEDHDFFGKSIKHALNAGDRERAIRLIEEHYLELWLRCEIGALESYIDTLMEWKVYDRPLVLLAQAWVLVGLGKPDLIEDKISAIHTLLDSCDPDYAALINDRVDSRINSGEGYSSHSTWRIGIWYRVSSESAPMIPEGNFVLRKYSKPCQFDRLC